MCVRGRSGGGASIIGTRWYEAVLKYGFGYFRTLGRDGDDPSPGNRGICDVTTIGFFLG